MKEKLEIIKHFSGVESDDIQVDLLNLKLDFLQKKVPCFSFKYVDNSNSSVDSLVFKFKDGIGIIIYDFKLSEEFFICGADKLSFKDYNCFCQLGEFFKAFDLEVSAQEILLFFEETFQ